MIEITDEVTIDKDADELFDYYLDVRNEAQWNPSLLSAVMQGDGPVGVGTRYDCQHKQMGKTMIEIVRADKPKALGFRMTGKMGTGGYDATFTPQGSGTKITGTMRFEPKGIQKLMSFMAKPMMRKEMRKTHTMLKQVVEKG